MPFIFKRLALFISIAAAFAADKEPPPFRPAAAATFAHRQTNAQVTIGAEPYDRGRRKGQDPRSASWILTSSACCPCSSLVQNDSGGAVRLDRLQAEYVGPNRNRVEATPAAEVRYMRGPDRPG